MVRKCLLGQSITCFSKRRHHYQRNGSERTPGRDRREERRTNEWCFCRGRSRAWNGVQQKPSGYGGRTGEPLINPRQLRSSSGTKTCILYAFLNPVIVIAYRLHTTWKLWSKRWKRGDKEEEIENGSSWSFGKAQSELFTQCFLREWKAFPHATQQVQPKLVSDNHSDSLKGAAPQPVVCIGRLKSEQGLYQAWQGKPCQRREPSGRQSRGLACLKKQTTNEVFKADRPPSTLAGHWQREIDGFLWWVRWQLLSRAFKLSGASGTRSISSPTA